METFKNVTFTLNKITENNKYKKKEEKVRIKML